MKKLLKYVFALILAVCTAQPSLGASDRQNAANRISESPLYALGESSLGSDSEETASTSRKRAERTHETALTALFDVSAKRLHAESIADEDSSDLHALAAIAQWHATHFQTEPDCHICNWPECTSQFTRPDSLRRHIRTVHRKEKPHQCPMSTCPKSFATKDALKIHVKNSHTDGNPLTCTFAGCTQSFNKKNKLTLHKISNHGQESPHKCPEPNCKKNYTSRGALNRHRVKFHRINPLTCAVARPTQSFSRKDARAARLLARCIYAPLIIHLESEQAPATSDVNDSNNHLDENNL